MELEYEKMIEMLKAKLWMRHQQLKGQYTLYALFMTVITLIAYVAVYPLLTGVLATAGITGIEGTLLAWTPVFILLFIIWGSMWYVNPPRGNQ